MHHPRLSFPEALATGQPQMMGADVWDPNDCEAKHGPIKISWGMILSPKMMILQAVEHLIFIHWGMRILPNTPKRGVHGALACA